MSAFATAEDLASLLQVPTVDRYTADLALDLASDLVRSETDQTIDVATTTESYDGLPASHPYAHVLLLRQVPVRSIGLIVSGGITLDPTDYTWSASGRVVRLDGEPFAADTGSTSVTYSHGWDVTSRQWRTARLVSLVAAARAYSNPQQVDAQHVGAIITTYGPTTRLTLTDSERRLLDILRR